MAHLLIKQLAEQKGISKAALARKADISPPTMDKMWGDPSESLGGFNIDKIEAVARALDVEIRELFVPGTAKTGIEGVD